MISISFYVMMALQKVGERALLVSHQNAEGNLVKGSSKTVLEEDKYAEASGR